jgi:hypothetical protein
MPLWNLLGTRRGLRRALPLDTEIPPLFDPLRRLGDARMSEQ